MRILRNLLAWLLPATNHFPRAHRHTVTRRLTDAALAKLRVYLRLAAKFGWLTVHARAPQAQIASADRSSGARGIRA